MRPEDLDELRALGFADDEILDVVLAAAARCFFSTVLDAVGAEPDAAYRSLDAPMRDALTVGRPIATGLTYGTSRRAGPTYWLSGRIRELAPSCSITCAVQPVTRLATNSGVNVGVSKPMRWYAGPVG